MKHQRTIVWLHSHFLYWMGGTKYIFEVVRRLAKNYRVLVVVEQASQEAIQQYRQAGVGLVVLGTPTSTSSWYWLTLPWRITEVRRRLHDLLVARRLTPQTTTLVSSMFPMNVITSHFWQYRRVQLCYEPFAFFYDPDFITSFSLVKQTGIRLLAKLYSHLDRRATQLQEAVLTLNTVTQESILETYGTSSHKVYAGVDSQRFQPFVSKELTNQYKNHAIAIHSTDYSPVKGTDRVIQAFAETAKKVPHGLLLITSTIANPTAEQKLQQLAESLGISDKIQFLGFVSYELLPQYYSLALVLVQGSNSSKSGTTSMALPVKEALCCGTPALRPDIGGEDVEDGVSGFLVDPSDTKALAQKMTLLLSQPEKAKRMGLAGRNYVAQRYTWERTVERIARYV